MTLPVRLGDILIRRKLLAPHQLGVALAVQRKLRLPLGQILLHTKVISRAQLTMALFQQKLSHRLGLELGRLKGRHYGHEFVTLGRSLLEKHVKQAGTSGADSGSPEATSRLRRELARLHPQRAGRIVEDDAELKERVLTGNF